MLRPGVLRACRLGTAASLTQRRILVAASSRVQVATSNRTLHSDSYVDGVPSPSKATYPATENEIRWRFPVDNRAEGLIAQVRHLVQNISSIITLNTATPITHQLMEEALNALYDKMESLRICFRLRENQLWVADMPERLLDFKSVSGCDRQKQHDDLIKSQFDLHNGPLWKARLMTHPENAPCPFPDVKAEFPHQYDLIISLHHAANDGTTLMTAAKTLVSVIDNLLQGLPVDRQAVGELRDGIEAREEENRMRAAFENDPARLKAALQEYEKGKHVPLLIEAFGTPSEVANPWTVTFDSYLIDNDVMSRLAHKGRSMGVTINAFMTAITNTALVETVRDAGLTRSNYSITGFIPVSFRRLMPRSSKPYLGNHGISMALNMDAPHNVKKNFWEYAKNLDTELRQQIKRNWVSEYRVLGAMTRPEGCTHEEYYSRPLPLCYDYMFSNLYSPGNYIEGNGKMVQVTRFEFRTVIHNHSFPLFLSFYGLRGQANLLMAYSTGSHTEEVVRRYFEKYLALLHDLSNALT